MAMVNSWVIHDGASESCVILHVPHSSKEIPSDVRAGIRLDEAALRLELLRMTDAFTDRIALAATDRSTHRPWAFINGISRLVVDPERFIDGTETMDHKGMGAVYTRTSQGEALRQDSTELRDALIDAYFRPYADALAHLVEQVLDSVGRVILIDVHSFPRCRLPYEDASDVPRPPICLGTDSFHTPPWLLSTAQAAFARLGESALDTPFSGTYVPLRYYRSDARISSLMVEFRRDLYMDEFTGEADPAGIVAAADCLTRLIDSVTLSGHSS